MYVWVDGNKEKREEGSEGGQNKDNVELGIKIIYIYIYTRIVIYDVFIVVYDRVCVCV